MFTTSEFAALTGLSLKALRLYGERDVLRPAHVDPSTGYRSYASAQLRHAQVLGFLRQAGMGLDDLRADPLDIDALREQVTYARRLEDFALDVAERLQRSTTELLEPTTRTMPATPWVGVTRTIGLPDARERADALVGQATGFDDAAEELSAAFPPATADEDLWWTTTWSAPAAQSVVVLLARPGQLSTAATHDSSFRVVDASPVAGSLPRRKEVSFSSVSGGLLADPVAEAAAGFLEILAFDAYRTARAIDDEPVVSRRVVYGATHPLAQDPGRPVTVFDLALG